MKTSKEKLKKVMNKSQKYQDEGYSKRESLKKAWAYYK